MKLLVDCSTARMGGAQTYTEEFLRAAGSLPERNRWVVYLPRGSSDRWGAPLSSMDVREAPESSATALGALTWLNRSLPRLALQEEVDVVFATTGFGMLRPTRPQVLLIRNPIYFSKAYQKRVRDPRLQLTLAARRWISLRGIQASQAVVFPTQAMRDLVARYLPGSDARWSIVPYGCSSIFSPGEAVPAELPRPLRENTGRFLLNVSHYCAQKNFSVLFEALGLLRRRGIAPPLALTTRMQAAPNCTFHQDQAILERENLRRQVIELGPLPRKSLPPLYRAARLFVFPSYVESFGHPLVEAMASGLPVLAADTPVNREICSEAALYADPFDPSAWAERIHRLLTEEPLRRQSAERGVLRAREFDWGRHAAQITRLCKEVGHGS